MHGLNEHIVVLCCAVVYSQQQIHLIATSHSEPNYRELLSCFAFFTSNSMTVEGQTTEKKNGLLFAVAV